MTLTELRLALEDDLDANLDRPGDRGWRALARAYRRVPSFAAVARYRVSRWLWLRGRNREAEWWWRRNIRASGCFLHPDAEIGARLILPHPVGIVVGMGARVGRGVTLYQHVTLGQGGDRGYPTLEDGVVVFTNAVVIGGVRLGAGAVIGAGAVVLSDVPANATAAGVPARVVGRA